MKFIVTAATASLCLLAGGACGYRLGTGSWPDARIVRAIFSTVASPLRGAIESKADGGTKPLYYRNPMGLPDTSPVPKKDSMGMDYIPVYADDKHNKTTAGTKSETESKVLYYRNPMGLPDTSPVPKKDSMGMDYLPVYADDATTGDDKTVKISLDRVQRSGVRSVAAELRGLVQPIHAHGKIAMDESTLHMVTLQTSGYIEKLYVSTTGQFVKAGEPLFRVLAPEISNAVVEYKIATASVGVRQGPGNDGALRRLYNLGLPKSFMDQIRQKGDLPASIDWPSPASGTVIEKMVIEGERAEPGRALFKIADLSRLWVIAEVAEQDLGMIRPGAKVSLTFRAFPGESVEGTVDFIYPDLMAETRTGRVRIGLANPNGRFKPDMYAEAVINAAQRDAETVTVPVDAVIESGSHQVIIIDKGEGKFEPRQVTVGMRGDSFIEIKTGVAVGENVVVSANFLIDAESNLRAALKAFTAEQKTTSEPFASAGAAQAAERVQ